MFTSFKMHNWTIAPGTKCDRDKLIFSAERGGQLDCVVV